MLKYKTWPRLPAAAEYSIWPRLRITFGRVRDEYCVPEIARNEDLAYDEDYMKRL